MYQHGHVSEKGENVLKTTSTTLVTHQRPPCYCFKDNVYHSCHPPTTPTLHPILLMKIDVTGRCQELFRDNHMSFLGRDVERIGPMSVLVVDEGLHVLCRQQRVNLHCVTITRGIPKLLPRHCFPAPSLPKFFLSLFPCNLYGLIVRPTL